MMYINFALLKRVSPISTPFCVCLTLASWEIMFVLYHVVLIGSVVHLVVRWNYWMLTLLFSKDLKRSQVNKVRIETAISLMIFMQMFVVYVVTSLYTFMYLCYYVRWKHLRLLFGLHFFLRRHAHIWKYQIIKQSLGGLSVEGLMYFDCSTLDSSQGVQRIIKILIILSFL